MSIATYLSQHNIEFYHLYFPIQCLILPYISLTQYYHIVAYICPNNTYCQITLPILYLLLPHIYIQNIEYCQITLSTQYLILLPHSVQYLTPCILPQHQYLSSYALLYSNVLQMIGDVFAAINLSSKQLKI